MLGHLTIEGVEMHDIETFREELVVKMKAETEELEEVCLNKEEEAHLGEYQMDWCTRCIYYLYVDLFHVCQFKHDNKCE